MKIGEYHVQLLRDIYQQVATTHSLEKMEFLLQKATGIAMHYGADRNANSLLNDLTQTRQKQFATVLTFTYDSDRYRKAFKDLRDHFLHDLADFGS